MFFGSPFFTGREKFGVCSACELPLQWGALGAFIRFVAALLPPGGGGGARL